MKKQMQIIFDGRALSNAYNKDISRGGLFFSTYNIFLELLKHKNLEVLIYSETKSYYTLKRFLQTSEVLRGRVKNVFIPCRLSKWISYGFYLRSKFTPKGLVQKFLAKSFTFTLLLCKFLSSSFDRILIDKNSRYIFFSPMHRVPTVFRNNDRIISFTLLHDTIPLVMKEYFGINKWFLELVASLNANDYYFANSMHTKNDFLKYCPQIDPDKISVTYLGANQNFYPDRDRAKNNSIKQKYHIPQDKKYIFSLCSLEPRKNLLFVVENFIAFILENQIQDVVFVLGGGHWEEFIKKLEKKIAGLGASKDAIIQAGYVDDADLASLYTHSLCSVYLSLYEGFGLPALEAMSCGACLIASNTTSIPEVVGDGGVLIDPTDALALKDAFKKIYFNPAFSKELGLKGIEQAKKFSWEICVGQMVAKMKSVYEKKILELSCH